MPLENEKSRTTADTSSQLEATEGMKTMKAPGFALTTSDGGADNGDSAGNGSAPMSNAISESSSQGDSDIGAVGGMLQNALGNGSQKIPPAPKKPVKDSYRLFNVPIDKDYKNRNDFLKHAAAYIFGGNIPAGLKWNPGQERAYLKSEKMVPVLVHESWFVAAKREKGIEVDDDGNIPGSAERLKKFKGSPDTKAKRDLEAEANRRYGNGTGKNGLTADEKKERDKELDYLLKIKEELETLPPEILALFRFTGDGSPYSPRDYERLYKIIRKLKGLTEAQLRDYFSKINNATSDLDAFEASIDRYKASLLQKDLDSLERGKLEGKLKGMEAIYHAYKAWLANSGGAGVKGEDRQFYVDKKQEQEKALTTALQEHGFGGIPDFQKYIADYENSFQKAAADDAMDMLRQYEGMLYKEGERFKDPQIVKALFEQMGGIRENHSQQRQAEAKAASSAGRVNGNPRGLALGDQNLLELSQQSNAASEVASSKKKQADDSMRQLAAQYPSLDEGNLPKDRQLDRDKIGSPEALGRQLQDNIALRILDAKKAKAIIAGTPEVVFNLAGLMPLFYQNQGIEEGTIRDLIIKDKIISDTLKRLAKDVLLGILVLALAAMTAGTASPWIAAIAATGGGILSAKTAVDSIRDYRQEKELADVGFADEPSIAWLILALVGTALEGAAAIKFITALRPAAKVFKETREIQQFTKALNSVAKAQDIDGAVILAVEKAAQKELRELPVVENLIAPRAAKKGSSEVVFKLNRKKFPNYHKIDGFPEAEKADEAAREAYAAYRASESANVDKVYVGKRADEVINVEIGAGKGMSVDAVATTQKGQYMLYEAKGRNIEHGLEQLQYSANELGIAKVIRYELVIPDSIQDGFKVINGILHVRNKEDIFVKYLINNHVVHVTFTK